MKVKNFKKSIALILAAIIAIMMMGISPSVFADDYVATIGEEGYATLAAAVSAVPTDGTPTTIKLLKDVDDGPGFIANAGQNFTIDFGGHRYVGKNPTVGSKGTETQCCQLLKGATVTFKNGTLETGGTTGKMVIQNYCNLTLDNMVIDGTTMEYSSNGIYVVSCNCGSITFKGNTVIKTKGQQRAFDLWYGMSAAYDEGITITFGKDFTGSITGTVEYGPAGRVKNVPNWEDKVKLNIENGNFDVTFEASNGNDLKKANINIKGGVFTSAPADEFIVDGYDVFKIGDKYHVLPKVTSINGYEYLTLKVGEAADLEIELDNEVLTEILKTEIMDNEEALNCQEGEVYKDTLNDKAVTTKDGIVTAVEPGVAIVYTSLENANGNLVADLLTVVAVYDIVPEDNANEADKVATEALLAVFDEIYECESYEEYLEILDKAGITEDEMDIIWGAMTEGAEITTEVVAEPLEEPAEEDVKLIGEKVEEGQKLAGYYDISVLIKVNGDEVAKLKELGKKIKVLLELSKDLPAVASGYTRTYSVIRLHDGKAEVIAKDVVAEDGKVPVETDLFSTYAITYEDKVATNPKTGDAIMIAVVAVIISVIGIGVTAVIKRK